MNMKIIKQNNLWDTVSDKIRYVYVLKVLYLQLSN